MLIITGTIAYDYIMDFPGLFGDHILPDQTHNINLSFIVEKLGKRCGGTAGNASYNLGLLGINHLLLSVVGKDFSEYKSKFKKFKIDTSHVIEDKSEYTASGFAMTDKKDNQIWGYFYGASKKISQIKLSHIAKKEDFVLVGPSGKKGTLSLVKQCVNLGLSYMFDPGFLLTDLTTDELRYGVLNSTHIVGNDYEVILMGRRIKDWPKIVAKKTVLTTLGEKGVRVQINGALRTIISAKASVVIDPTGAGDAWRAGFLAGINRGDDPVSSAQIANVVASFAVEKYGAQEHVFTKQSLKDRYRQTYHSLLEW